MTNRIADLRTSIKTLDEADKLFEEYVITAKRVAVADARHDLRVAKMQAAHNEKMLPDRELMAKLKEQIAGYVTAHREQFEKPRTRKTEQGEYGMRTVTDVEITNEQACIEALEGLGYIECFERIVKPVKKNIKRRLKAEENIPGAHLRTGDTVVCKPNKALIDEAKEQALDA